MILNRSIVGGRLTRDPELRKTKNNLSVCYFTIASDRMKTKNNPEPGADFISCSAWRGTAEFLEQYAAKGDLVIVEGKITTGSYKDADGKTVYTTEVTADNVQLISSRRQSQEGYTPEFENNPGKTKHREMTMNSEPIGTDDYFDGAPEIDIGQEDLPFY